MNTETKTAIIWNKRKKKLFFYLGCQSWKKLIDLFFFHYCSCLTYKKNEFVKAMKLTSKKFWIASLCSPTAKLVSHSNRPRPIAGVCKQSRLARLFFVEIYAFLFRTLSWKLINFYFLHHYRPKKLFKTKKLLNLRKLGIIWDCENCKRPVFTEVIYGWYKKRKVK